MLSAWDAVAESHKYDIDTREVLRRSVAAEYDDYQNTVMTAMTSACDTVWVGMSSGHIMVLHERELLYCVQPYSKFVRFLYSIPGEGCIFNDCCRVVSGGKEFNPFFPEYEVDQQNPNEKRDLGVLVLWEAHSSSTLKKMRHLEEDGGKYLENHSNLAKMVHTYGFKDPTHVLKSGKARMLNEPHPLSLEGSNQKEDSSLISGRHCVSEKILDIDVCGEVIRILCQPSAPLESIMEELAENSSGSMPPGYCLSYTASDSGMVIKIMNNEDLQQLLSMENHAKLNFIPV